MDIRLQKWHEFVATKDVEILNEMLDDNVEFHSPTVWAPKLGKEITSFILSTVIDVFEDFTYHREWVDGNEMALEFSANIDSKAIKGIDLVRWNDDGKIIHFEVMGRPINGMQLLLEKMMERMTKAGLL